MAKINFLDLNPSLKTEYEKGLKQGDRFYYSKICAKKNFVSRKRKEKLIKQSFISNIKDLWDNFTSSEKEAWKNAGRQINMKGYNLFVQDQSYRLKNNIPGVATPSNIHQFLVGNIHIENPSMSASIVQKHFRSYWLNKKVFGKKSMIEPVKVIEDFSLPLKIGLGYSGNLNISGSNPFANFYAKIWHSFKGENLLTFLKIPLDFSTPWKYVDKTISFVDGYVVKYDLGFEINDLQGDLFFDNIQAIHSGQNWAIDSKCNDINNTIQETFFLTTKNWVAKNIEEGSSYKSIYKNY